MKTRLLICFLLLPFFFAHTSPAEETSVGLVLDCSASMWNKLDDGRYRIDAAKSALVNFLSETPAREDLHIGLRIYGARIPYAKPGACKDTELVVPIDGFHRQKMIDAIRQAKAVGATPLALSLQEALGDFQKPGIRKLIVCTDGEESCGGDVEAALQALKEADIHVDVRIIGIGLPEAAAKRFADMGVPVENVHSLKGFADALVTATRLADTPEEPQKIAPRPLRVRLVRNGAPLAGQEIVVTHAMDGRRVPVEPSAEGEFRGEALPGSYQVEIQPANRIYSNQSVSMEGETKWVFDLTEAPAVKLEVTPKEVSAGQNIEVRFSGAAGIEGEWLGMRRSEEMRGADVLWLPSGGGKSGKIEFPAPALPGKYRMVFFSRVADEEVLAGESEVFEIKMPEVSLKIPEEVPVSSEITVEWKGPGLPGDWIGWVEAGEPDGAFHIYGYPSQDGAPLRLVGPSKPGKYEMRYANEASPNVLARAPFSVVKAEVALLAPEQAPVGSKVSIQWQGPNTSGVYLTIVPKSAGDGEYQAYEYTENAPGTVLLQAPRETGEMEIRIVTPDSVVLARRPLQLIEIESQVVAPKVVAAEREFPVQWRGPGGDGDFITVVPQEAGAEEYLSYAYVGESGADIRLVAPAQPGVYEVRYISGDGRILARQLVKVE